MANLSDCLGKAVKAGMLTEEESTFVQERASTASGMTRKEAELWAARDMLRDAMAELDSIARQVGKPAPVRESKVVFRSRSKEAAMAAMLEEVQVVAENKLAMEAGEGSVVSESQTAAEGELTAAIPSEGDAAQKKTRTYEAMREKVLGLIAKNRQEIAAMEAERGMTEEQMRQAGITEKPEPYEIAREKMLSALGELNAVMKFLPPEVRGKAGGFFELAKSEAPLGKILSDRLQRVASELDKLMTREYSERISSLVKGAQAKKKSGVEKSTLGPEAKDTVDFITEAVAMNAETAAKRTADIDARLGQEITAEEQLDLMEEMAIVNAFSDIKNRPVEQLADAYHWLADFVKEARSKWRAKEEARIAQDRAKSASIVEEAGKPGEQGLARLNTHDLASLGHSFVLTHKSFTQFLRAILPNSAFTQQWADRARRAENAAHDETLAAGNRLTATLQEAIGDKGRISMANAMRDLKWRRFGKGVDATVNGEKLHMSKLEAMQYILSWDQTDVREKMLPYGWNEESINQLREATNDRMSQAVINFLRDEYDSLYKTINPVYRRMYGMNMPKHELYAPTRFDHAKGSNETSPLGVPTMQSGIVPGFVKRRVSHDARMLRQDALMVYWQHVAMAQHWTQTAELTREMRAVIGNRDARESLKAKYGQHVYSQLNSWVDAISKQGYTRANEIAAINWMIGGLTSAKAISSLGLNLRSVAMQTDSGLRFMVPMSMRRIVAAITDRNFFSNIPKAWHSDTIQRRVMSGGTIEARYMFDKAQVTPSVLLELARASMMPMQLFDSYLTSLSAAVVYTDAHKQAVAQGMNDAQAEGFATEAMDAAVFNFSQPIGITNRSLMELSGGPLLKMFTLFMSDPRLKTALMVESIQGLVTGKGNRVDHARRILAVELMAIVAQTVANFYRDAFTDDDDDEIWTQEGYMRAMLLAPLSGWFVLGTAAEAGISKLLGEKWWKPSRDPLIEAVERFIRVADEESLRDLINFDDPSAMFKEWENVSRSLVAAGAIAGPPGSPVVALPSVILNALKPAFGARKNITEEPEERSATENIRASIFGNKE